MMTGHIPARRRILVAEASMSVAAALEQRLRQELPAIIVHCRRFEDLSHEIQSDDIALAITGLSLPDAEGDRILSALTDRGIPTVVFTAYRDKRTEHGLERGMYVEYIVKEGEHSFGSIVATAKRIFQNQQFTVLTVDDSRANRSKLSRMLATQNFNTLEAASGREALSVLERHPEIDLVITDYHMAEMDGYELIKTLRRLPMGEKLRIIGISSSDDRLLSAQFIRAGASDFIYSPFIAEELQCRIDANIETLRQMRHLRYLAEIDPLTSLANRRHFFNTAASRVQADIRNGQGAALALMDIDHFKLINDHFGHEAGDAVLTRVGQVLNNAVADGQHLVARFGGEEFCLYLHNLTGQRAVEFCEDLRQRLAASEVAVGNDLVRFTVSVGVIDVRPELTLDQALYAADRQLYVAKNAGRNRVSAVNSPNAV